MSAEVEAKLSLHPGDELPDLAAVVGELSVAGRAPIELRAVYFDTADLRLIRAGATLRHRPEDDVPPWQVKLPGPDWSDAIARDERAYQGDGDEPPAAANEQVLALTRGAALEPVARIVTIRHTTEIREDDQVRAEVADDQVTGFAGNQLVARFREVEVESDDDDLRQRLIQRLEEAGAEATENRPKLVRVLGPAATAPADLTVPPAGRPDPAQPVVRLVSRAMLVDLDRWIRHDPGTRRGEDIEDLHQMRVATRRLRTTLRTYRDVLDREWADDLRGELAPLAGLLGEVRDLDVQIDHVTQDLTQIGAERTPAAHRLLEVLEGRRRAARERLLSALRDDAYTALLDRSLEAATHPRCPEPDAPAGPTLAPMVRRAWRRVRKATKRDAPPHEVRLKLKRLRYAAEAVEPAFGEPAQRLAKAAADGQDVLGIVQDADVSMRLHRELVTVVDEPEAAFLLGRLSQLAADRRAAAEGQWPELHKALRRRKLRAFLE